MFVKTRTITVINKVYYYCPFPILELIELMFTVKTFHQILYVRLDIKNRELRMCAIYLCFHEDDIYLFNYLLHKHIINY